MNHLQLRITLPIFLATCIGNSTATANLLGDYVVSSNPKPIEQRRSLSSGSRTTTCNSALNSGDIELLVPKQEVVHLTTVDNPSLYFVSREKNVPYKFTLVNPKTTKVLMEKDMTIEQKGLQEIKVNKNVNLEKGQVYLWYVAFPCQNNDDEAKQYYDVLTAGIEKRNLSIDKLSDLEQSQNTLEKVSIYLQNGFWYDALTESVKHNKEESSALLESAGMEY